MATAVASVRPSGSVPSVPRQPISHQARKRLVQTLGAEARPILRLLEQVASAQRHPLTLAETLPAEIDAAISTLARSPRVHLTPQTRNQLFALRGRLRLACLRWARGPADSKQPARLAALLGEAVLLLSEEYDLPLGRDADTIRCLRPVEVDRLEVQRTDPAAFRDLEQRRRIYQRIDANIEEAIRQHNLVPDQVRLLGRLVHLGRDPATGEEVVFDLDGERLSVADFVAKRKRSLAAERALARPREQTALPPASMRRFSPEALAATPGDVEWMALSDDLARAGALTRIYPTRWVGGTRVVCDGRFAGIAFDDLVNSEGRMIEGTAFDYDPQNGRCHAVPVRRNPGEREPYVTVSEERAHGETRQQLFVQIPCFQGRATDLRRAMRRLARAVPSVQYRPGSRNTCFCFAPKDFAAVREALGSLSVSSAALRLVRSYFEELAGAERAVAAANLEHYNPQAIGGFKPRLDGAPFRFLDKQRQALAWLEANGFRGVCALDTGMGKTLVAIAMMQKLIRDGVAGADGRFLFVCPAALRGNLPKEIDRFLQPAAAAALLARVDIVSYAGLRRKVGAGALSGRRYVAAFFDEAQSLKNHATRSARVALALGCPRTVCLTASPLEHDPKEAYVLAAVAAGRDLWHPANGRDERRQLRKFLGRYCQRVGGRPVGVHPDPLRRLELHTWVKRNVFWGDKAEVPEHPLPPLRRQTVTIAMRPEVERAYRAVAARLADVMRGMVALLCDRGMLVVGKDDNGRPIHRVNPLARDPRVAQMFGVRFAPILAQLNDLALRPERLVPGAGFPKLDCAARLVWRRLRRSRGRSRALLFAEDRGVVVESARRLSQRIPIKVHAACLADRIRLFKNGEELHHFRGFDLPFVRRRYDADGRTVPEAEWQTFVLRHVLAASPEVATLSLVGQIYNQGQNLQAFDTVIHLDRDSWNNEDMKQRTARAWRFGQQNAVVEYTLDLTYASRTRRRDPTLDELRSYHQTLEGELFDETLKAAQGVALGQEWFDMPRKQASLSHIDAQTLRLSASPYARRSRPPRWSDPSGHTTA
jgi:hypothetical protein